MLGNLGIHNSVAHCGEGILFDNIHPSHRECINALVTWSKGNNPTNQSQKQLTNVL